MWKNKSNLKIKKGCLKLVVEKQIWGWVSSKLQGNKDKEVIEITKVFAFKNNNWVGYSSSALCFVIWIAVCNLYVYDNA